MLLFPMRFLGTREDTGNRCLQVATYTVMPRLSSLSQSKQNNCNSKVPWCSCGKEGAHLHIYIYDELCS